MVVHIKSRFVALASFAAFGAILLGGLPARAGQIAIITGPKGQPVFVNANLPPAPSRAKFSPATPASARYKKIVKSVALRHHVDPKLVQAVIRVESDYHKNAVSSKGAQGLMQLIPATAERFGVTNPFNARQNIEGGTTYLHYLLTLFHGNVRLALAAYNAGENAVLESGGIPPYQETRRYVHKVTALYHPGRLSALKPSPPPVPPVREYVDAHGVVHFTNVD